MAKGRKPPHGADRLLGTYRHAGAHPSASGDLPDLVEADVWYSPAAPSPESTSTGTTPIRNGRQDARHVGGLSRAFADGRHVTASAPVEVPVWPSRFTEPPEQQQQEEEDEDEDTDVWAPPHVYLARRQAKAAAAASVVEGAGRTLKGRDLSRVRDAVWSRTGFYG